MAKNVWKNGLVNGMQNSIGGEDERFSDAAIEAEKKEQEEIDGKKYKIRIETKLQVGTCPAGAVATGKKWREIAGARGEQRSIAPAIFDRLDETNDAITIE